MTRLDTEELFRSGATAGDRDAVMLLDHKQAIEFMVENVPLQGLGMNIVSNLHAVLMQDLLEDDAALGAIRQKVVRISDTVYTPAHMPQLLREMLERVLAKAAQVNNPLEAAFFLWVNLAYLQPFEDGNKRVSRLAANIPLMLFNCAPLSARARCPSELDRGRAAALIGGAQRDSSTSRARPSTTRRQIRHWSLTRMLHWPCCRP